MKSRCQLFIFSRLTPGIIPEPAVLVFGLGRLEPDADRERYAERDAEVVIRETLDTVQYVVHLYAKKTPMSPPPPTATSQPAQPTPVPPAPTTQPSVTVVALDVATVTGKGSRTRHVFSKDGGGTDDQVHLVLEGVTDKGAPYSGQFNLEDPSKNDREQGQTDNYTISAGELQLNPIPYSSLRKAGFRKTETSGTTKVDGDWLLREFTIACKLADGSVKTFKLAPNQWFSTGDMAQFTWPMQ